MTEEQSEGRKRPQEAQKAAQRCRPTGRAEKSAGRAEKRPYRAEEKAAATQEAADRRRRGHRSRAAEQDRSRQPTGGPPLLCPVLCVRLRHRTGRGPQGGSEEQPPAFVVSCRSRGSSGKAAQRAGAAEQRQRRQEGQRRSTAAPFSLHILRPSCWP